MNYFHSKETFELESGEVLPEITIAYQTYGTLNETGSNVVWICHALTANAEVAEWWPGMIGDQCILNPEQYFIVCANILGSCYGTTGPQSIDPRTGQQYLDRFPFVTIRDMVTAHQLLFRFLRLRKIHLLVGGSMGGYQALEWTVTEPSLIERLFLLATSARETAWGIAIHTAQRLAIEADHSWKNGSADAGLQGLRAARAIAMLTYRNYQTYQLTQEDPDPNKVDHFKASSYILHQGNKLASRFNALSYWILTKAMDSHNLMRSRNVSMKQVLQQIHQETLVIAINHDLLCPLPEMELLAQHLPAVTFHQIDSLYGHDGFLTEHRAIAALLSNWL